MSWYFLNTGFQPGSTNMAIDLRLARRMELDPGPPILRVYGWSPPAVSLGYNQPDTDVDRARCARFGIDLVRRPTGGRAILHAHELTYSITMHAPSVSGRDVYEHVSNALLEGVRIMGIDASKSGSTDDFRKLSPGPAAVPCFATSARSEIQSHGRKLIGSAQRRFGEVILQHGSLLLGSDHLRLSELLSEADRVDRERVGLYLKDHSIDASTILGRPVGFDETVECIRAGFSKVFATEMVEYPGSRDDLMEAPSTPGLCHMETELL